MRNKNPNKVVNQYIKATSVFDSNQTYKCESLKEILERHVSDNEHLLLKHDVVEFASDTRSYIPPYFVAEIGDEFYLVAYRGGKFYYSFGIEFKNISDARCFYIKRSTRYLVPEMIVSTLIKRTPRVSLMLLMLVFFVLASPTYSNLFNSRLVHGESVTSLLFISGIFVVIFIIEYFLKKTIMTEVNRKIEYETKASEYFFFDVVSKTSTKDAIVQWKTATESIVQIWRHIGQLMLDLLTVSLIMAVFGFLLGAYAVFPITIYVIFMITALKTKFDSYQKILAMNQLNDQKLTYLIGMNRSKKLFSLLNFEMIRDKWRSMTDEVSRFNESILNHEETSSGVLKLYTSTSIVIIFISAYFAIRGGSLEQSSVIALMLLNGRCASAIAASCNRIYQIVISKSKMVSSVAVLHEDELPMFGRGAQTLEAPMDGINLLEVSELAKTFDGKSLFNDLSFQVKSGESLCIVGKVGSGKTTLMKILAGVEIPSMGQSTLNGVSVAEYCEEFSTRELAYYSPEDKFLSDSLYFNFEIKYGKASKAIFDNLKFFGCNYVMSQEAMHQEKADTLPVSTGQMQRLLMVRSIGEQPSVIVMDEPCSNFSPDEAKIFMTQLRRRYPNAILIYTTHNPILMQSANKLLDMDRGEVKVISEARQQRAGKLNIKSK
ncbi:ABC transporter domain-containing protein [Vibrio chagasii]|nr:ABC transporter domain-containing protein [Vibrio chagasii]